MYLDTVTDPISIRIVQMFHKIEIKIDVLLIRGHNVRIFINKIFETIEKQ